MVEIEAVEAVGMLGIQDFGWYRMRTLPEEQSKNALRGFGGWASDGRL